MFKTTLNRINQGYFHKFQDQSEFTCFSRTRFYVAICDCRNLWSRPWRGKLSPIRPKTCSVYLAEYPCSLLTWIWKIAFLPILVLFHRYICLCVCISVILSINDVHRETFLKGSDVYANVFSVLRGIPSGTIHTNLRSCTLKLTNCDNHK